MESFFGTLKSALLWEMVVAQAKDPARSIADVAQDHGLKRQHGCEGTA
jgi:hypothetical protein